MKSRRWLIPYGFLALLVFGTGSYTWMGERDYQRELSLAGSEGLIVTPEYLAGVPAPAAENAAGIYQSAINSFRGVPHSDYLLFFHFSGKPADEKVKFLQAIHLPASTGAKEVDAAARSYEPCIELLKQAVDRPRLDFQRDWSLPMMRELSYIRRITEAAMIGSRRALEQGRYQRAFELIALVRRVARQLDQEPSLESYWTASDIWAATDRMALKIAWLFRENGKVVQLARNLLKESQPRPDLKRGVQAALLKDLTIIDLIRRNPAALGYKGDDLWRSEIMLGRLPQVQTQLKKMTLRTARREWATLGSKSLKEMGERLKKIGDIDDEDPLVRFASFGWGTGLYRYVNRALDYECQAAQALALTYVIDVYRATGNFPKALPDAAQGILDPHSGKPFEYQVASDHCLLGDVGRAATYNSHETYLPFDYKSTKK